ncbi:MAG: DNA-processing protein DprA [Peptostreptococcaceae bacterium]|nr:DNA-processing protein DprA [Peptostreptococcaceae bacterium]
MRSIELALHQAEIRYEEYLNIINFIDDRGDYDPMDLLRIIGEKKERKVRASLDQVHKNIERMEKEEIGSISCKDEMFPKFLLEMPDPCYLLYYRGDISLLDSFSIGMVGSRKPTSYGSYVANKFSSELSRSGVVIVSGLAQGIDTLSHKGATESNGKTIAVLGTAINNIYPRKNEGYAKELIQGGSLILSEFAPDHQTMPFHFVQRNRLISALSDGLLIVEAGERSGTLTTVDFALEQGKPVFAVPGNINSPNSVGTNRLLKAGAKLVTEIEDILEEFLYFKPKREPDGSDVDLSEEERAVVAVLREKGILTNEEISLFTNQSIKYIIGTLGVLEIKGIIKDLGNNTFTIK